MEIILLLLREKEACFLEHPMLGIIAKDVTSSSLVRKEIRKGTFIKYVTVAYG